MCLNEYASHPIQTLIDNASSKVEIEILLQSIIKTNNSLINLCINSNGTYVVRKIIQCINVFYF